MYAKNLSEDLRLRLSSRDMDFLRSLSTERECTVSEVIRSIIGEYRRSLDTVRALNSAIALIDRGGADHGVTKTDFDNKL